MSHVFHFINEFEKSVQSFDSFIDGELRVVSGLLLTVVVDLSTTRESLGYQSDFSMHGYAALRAALPKSDVFAAVSCFER